MNPHRLKLNPQRGSHKYFKAQLMKLIHPQRYRLIAKSIDNSVRAEMYEEKMEFLAQLFTLGEAGKIPMFPEQPKKKDGGLLREFVFK